MEYKTVLSLAGGFGVYQAMVYIWYILITGLMSGNMIFMVFGSITCPKQEFSNGTNNYTILDNSSEDTGCEGVFHSVAQEWGLVGAREYLLGMMITLQFAGLFIGAIVGGQISDRFGRMVAARICVGGVIFFTLLSSFTTNWQQLATIRFFIGLFMGPMKATDVLFTEVVLPQHRLIYEVGGDFRYTVSLVIGWPITYIWNTALAYWTQEWRYYAWAICATTPITILLTFLISESPKWLLCRGQTEKARIVILKMAKINRVRNLEKVGVAADQLDLMTKPDKAQTKKTTYTYLHLFKMGVATKYFLIIVFTVGVDSSAYYGLLFSSAKLSGDVVLNLIFTMLTRGTTQSVLAICDVQCAKLGRKMLCGVGYGIVLCCFIWFIIAHSTTLGLSYPLTLTIASILGVTGTASIGSLGTQGLLVELVPTPLRNMSKNLSSSIGRLTTMISPQIFLLFKVWKPLPYLIYLVLLVLSYAAVLGVLPETKGSPLPDTIHQPKAKSASVAVELKESSNVAPLLTDAYVTPEE